MDARLTQAYLEQRTAASHAVAGALVPRSANTTFGSTAKAAATGATTSSTSSAGTSSDITSSDFLTLLVSELQNQDPTQPTDPNEYITQLAQVNSLEQLIQINSGISTLDSSVPSTGSSATGSVAGSSATANSHAASLEPASAPPSISQIHKQIPGTVTQ